MKLNGFATLAILLQLKLSICNLSEINPSGAVSLEAHKNTVESITTAIKHLDEVVLDTKKQLWEFAKAFQVESEMKETSLIWLMCLLMYLV